MKKIREFFGIKTSYTFEIMDMFTIVTIINVTLIVCGFWWAPVVGILNCVFNIIYNIKNRVHINCYVMQLALLVLNIYFLTL